MRSLCLPLCVALSVTASLGCGPAPEAAAPGTAKPADGAAGPAAPVQQVAAAAPADLSPVAEPADMVGVLRWKSPKAMITALSTCASLPLRREMIDMGAQQLAKGALREILRGGGDTVATQLASLVALDAPVDAVATLDVAQRRRSVLAAVAVGLTSLEQAKAAVEPLGPPVELMPGVFRVGSRESQRDVACVLSVSGGSTPARLVCGPREKDATTLAPYLTRTMPVAAPAPSDLHVELRVTPIDARFGGMVRQQLSALPVLAQAELGIDDPKLERAVIEAATSVGEELGMVLSDLDKITLDASVSPSACGKLTGAIELRGRSSWFAGTITERPERAGPAPAIFWRAPKDSHSVVYGRGADTTRYGSMLRTLRILLDGALASGGIGTPADRKALTDLVRLPVGSDVTTVTASGGIDMPAATNPTAQQNLDAAVNKWLGWRLFGVDEGPDSLTKFFKDVVSTYHRKGLMDPIRKELGSDAKVLPVIKTVAAPAQLGQGAVDIEAKFELPARAFGASSGKKTDKVKFSAHLLIMPDGKQRTWVALGANRDELVKRLRAVRSDAPDSGTLAARSDLEKLKTGRHMSAGFATLQSVIAPFTAMAGVRGALPRDARQIVGALASMPNRGQTPLFLTTSVTGGNVSRSEISFEVPKGAFEDLGSVIFKSMQAAGVRMP